MVGIGFSLQGQYDEQMISLLKDNGFSAVSPLWAEDLDMEALTACLNKYGMKIQSLHAPHKNISLLWQPDLPDSLVAQERILRCIDACSQYQVPIMVVHGWQGVIYTFPKEPLNFRFFDKMVAYAQEKGVCIAFENLEGEEYLAELMARYPSARFCWDSGHDNCYPHKTDFLKAYGDRLVMTHLNDNFGLRDPNGIPSGLDDLHFLPYDGKIDWASTINRLKDAPKQEILNLEIKLRSHSTAPQDLPYVDLPIKTFIAMAGKRAKQIAELYENCAQEGIT